MVVALQVLVGFECRALDSDGDGMSDDYEYLFLLDAANASDAMHDYDSDTLVNLAEFGLSTDPYEADTDRDGLRDDVDSDPVSCLYIDWGEVVYTFGDYYEYTGPAWWINAYKIGGQWATNFPTAWHVSSGAQEGVGVLAISVDRVHLVDDLTLAIRLFDHTNSSVYVSLYDTTGAAVASNISGNLLSGTGTQKDVVVGIPFRLYPSAVTIGLCRGVGEITIYESLLFSNQAHGGLTNQQEMSSDEWPSCSEPSAPANEDVAQLPAMDFSGEPSNDDSCGDVLHSLPGSLKAPDDAVGDAEEAVSQAVVDHSALSESPFLSAKASGGSSRSRFCSQRDVEARCKELRESPWSSGNPPVAARINRLQPQKLDARCVALGETPWTSKGSDSSVGVSLTSQSQEMSTGELPLE